jgi:hypothetical protein
MLGSTLRSAIAVMALGVLGTLGLAVVAEAIGRRRAARPPTEAGAPGSDAADPGNDRGDLRGSPVADWSAILPALRLARGELPEEASTGEEVPREDSSKREPGQQKTAPGASSKQSADNGHRRPKTDRSA